MIGIIFAVVFAQGCVDPTSTALIKQEVASQRSLARYDRVEAVGDRAKAAVEGAYSFDSDSADREERDAIKEARTADVLEALLNLAPACHPMKK